MQYHTSQVNRLGNRHKNQDRVAIVERDGVILLTLADGLGGHQRGELASQKAMESMICDFGKLPTPIADPKAFLSEAVANAHAAIVSAGQACDPAISPRTTCVMCVVQNGVAHWAHVGDSRLYIFRDNAMLCRTVDHSIVEQLIQDGVITEEMRTVHPRRHQITRCLGGETEPKARFGEPTQMVDGDVILLCSDGLWDPMGHEGIGTFLREHELDTAITLMAHEAEMKSHPRSDNISVAAFCLISGGQARLQPTADVTHSQKDADADLQKAVAHMKASIAQYRSEVTQNN